MKKVEIDYFKEYQFPSSLRSNGAESLSFVTRRANMAENRYDTTLWLWREGCLTQLTAPGKLSGHWWAGHNTLLLARPGGEKEQAWTAAGLPFTLLQRLKADGPGEALDLARLFLDVEDLAPLPDGRFLLLARTDFAAEAALAAAGGDADKAAEALTEEADYEVLTELPFWENGGGFTSGRRRRLYLLSGGQATPLTDEVTELESLQLSADGKTAWFIAHRVAPRAPIDNRLCQLNIESMEITDISFAESLRYDAVVPLESGALLVAGSDMKAFGINQNPAFYRLDPATGAARTLYDGGLHSGWQSVAGDLSMAGGPVWAARGEDVYWISTLDESSHLMRINAETGEITQVTRPEGTVNELALHRDGCAVIASRGLDGPEIYAVAPDGTETRFTAFNAGLASEYALQKAVPLACTNQEDTEIRGFVLLPPELKEGEKCPAILNIHGGPKGVYGPGAFHEMQYWAARGYAVLFCNPTGGDGRGDAFSDIRGRYGSIDYDDIMAFLTEALAHYPCIDQNRLGVTGGSYGGFMTNWIIGQTGRFAAAASQRSISNWASMANTSDIGYLFEPDQAGATVWENAEAVWNQSPLKYAHRVTTPTLFIHSDEDYRCPLPEGIQMYNALMDHGVESRLVMFRGENHELSRSGKPKHRVRRLREITDWFDRFLMDK